MSTPRRALSAGPTSTRTTTTAEERTPRLLPVERADHDDQDHDEAETGSVLRGRRPLGMGTAAGTRT
ncbi:hypothetical protein JHN52_28270 [Streptomyces sp. MBT97]|uniref:hypothetical protein n=1 Tax=Streptomyces sp. MBT97 TaxID=2800411 RepID=UPI001909523B|nr:hypothetical protein [Streptomyces sp. MBT97]MBK3636730.1 hypothetical protein [Streptomyces sp. MBT97]